MLCRFFSVSGMLVLSLMMMWCVCFMKLVELLIDMVGMMFFLVMVVVLMMVMLMCEGVLLCNCLVVFERCWLMNMILFVLIFLCSVGLIWNGRWCVSRLVLVIRLLLLLFSEVLVMMVKCSFFCVVWLVSVCGMVLVLLVWVKLFRLMVMLLWKKVVVLVVDMILLVKVGWWMCWLFMRVCFCLGFLGDVKCIFWWIFCILFGLSIGVGRYVLYD